MKAKIPIVVCSMQRLIIIIPLILLSIAGLASAEHVIHVDCDATGTNDGTSWANAYCFLQDALADANSIAKPVEIRVAQGIYRPDRNSAEPNGTGDSEVSFKLINGVTIKGGYAGYGQAEPDVRDTVLYETILSGDLNGDDYAVQLNTSDNSQVVLNSEYNDNTACINGFTITGGYGDRGPGITCQYGNPVFADCTISDNRAVSGSITVGGGVLTLESSAEFVNCTFLSNGATKGGGIYNSASSPLLRGCLFVGNGASEGGAMFNVHSSPQLFSCKFVNNRASFSSRPISGNGGTTVVIFKGEGGAIYNRHSEISLTNCVFAGNRAAWEGGAIYSYYGTGPILTNCTLTGNSASHAEALVYSQGARLLNCVVWNGSQAIEPRDSGLVVVHSNTQGGWPGDGNIDADPCFAAPGYWDPNGTPEDANDDFWADGDYHLKSQAGRWDANSQTWVQDDVTSPCIDAGDPMTAIGQEPFPNGGIINMGAYGGTSEAGKSYFGEPVCETIVAGDLNGDCRVGFEDFMIMALHWLEDTKSIPTEIVTIEIPLACAGRYEPNSLDCKIDLDLGVSFTSISHVYMDWSGEAKGGLYEDFYKPTQEPSPINEGIYAYLGDNPSPRYVIVSGGKTTYPEPEAFDCQSKFELWGSTWSDLFDGQGTVVIGYSSLGSGGGTFIEHGFIVLNEAALVIRGAMITEP